MFSRRFRQRADVCKALRHLDRLSVVDDSAAGGFFGCDLAESTGPSLSLELRPSSSRRRRERSECEQPPV